MSELSSNRILKIYKSRNTILELLRMRGYNITDYSEFSINEIDAMYSNDQLDMLLTKENGEKVSIDFLTSKGWRQFTSGFIVGGFGGAGIGYILLKFFNF